MSEIQIIGERQSVSLPSHIVFVAPNQYFRIAREETLRSAGYLLTSFSTTAEALLAICTDRVRFDLVLVCDSTPADQRARLIATVKAISPHTPVLVIGDTREALADGVVSDFDGPEALLDHIEGLLLS